MDRRSVLSGTALAATASLLATTSVVVPQLAKAADSGHYGRPIKLDPVTGDAKIIFKRRYDRKRLDARFEGSIIILKFLFYGHYLVVVGIIKGTVTAYGDSYHRPLTIEIDDYFKAEAELSRADYDGHDYEAASRYRPKWPPHDHEDCDLLLDIGKIRLKKEIEFDDKGDKKGPDYGHDKKVVVIIKIDPDEAPLEVYDRKLKKILCELAGDDSDHHDPYEDRKPDKELSLG